MKGRMGVVDEAGTAQGAAIGDEGMKTPHLSRSGEAEEHAILVGDEMNREVWPTASVP